MAQPSAGHVIIVLKGGGYSLSFAFFTDTAQQEGSGLAQVTSQPASTMPPADQSTKK